MNRPKEPKAKGLQFTGQKASIHAGSYVPPPKLVRQGTPAPSGPGTTNKQNPQKTGNDPGNHAMPFQQPPPRMFHHIDSKISDIWETIKTVESSSTEASGSGPTATKNIKGFSAQQHKNQGQFTNKQTNKEPRHLLEYNGHDLSVTDLLPPISLGNDTSAPVVQAPKIPKNNSKVTLGVQNGLVFVPSKIRNRPGQGNSFADSRDIGHVQTRNKWTIDIGNYRDDEVSFTLEASTLLIEGKQISLRGQERKTSEIVELPTGFDIDHLRVYRNLQMGTIIIAYVPHNQF